jgi:hypothetical protein
LNEQNEDNTIKACLKDLKLINNSNNKNQFNVKEMPLNPFDFIWYTNNLVPKQDETTQNRNNIIEAMYEEYALYKSKSILGTTDNKSNTNQSSNNWSFSSSNNTLFSDDCTMNSSTCIGVNSDLNNKKKKEKKAKFKKNKKKFLSHK